MSYDVFGMCNPLYDITVEISDAILAEIGREIGTQKGGMFLIDEEQQRALVARTYEYIVDSASGGSGANTMIGLALLGGKACYAGKIGNDEHGTLYSAKLREQQVAISVTPGEGTTGICVVMLTPDAERTMCTFLGISRELGPADVDEEAIRASKYIYVTGFLWDTDTQKAAVLHAMRTAHEAGVKVALSLSDPFCVGRHKEDFLKIAREHVDLLIGNHEEAQHLTDTDNPHDAIQAMAPLCDMTVVTMGGRGALLRQGDTLVEVPASKVEVVDTNGAGDMYAAGILYGLTHGLSLEQTGRVAAYAAGQVVAKLGPRLDSLDHEAVRQILAN
jgi:sugar/nucleoside kinase (ribokinase family)